MDVDVNLKRTNPKLLLVIDESSASKRAVAYVARMVGGRKGFRLCLAHVLPPLPSGLLEFRGAENPDEEKRLDAELKIKQRRFLALAREAAEEVLAGAFTTLRKAGVPRSMIETRFFASPNGNGAAGHILEMARAGRYHTVIVGRESVSWFRELVHGDIAEELVRHGRGLTIWVIE